MATYPLQIRLAIVQHELESVLGDADVEELDDVGVLEFHQDLDLAQDREVDAVLRDGRGRRSVVLELPSGWLTSRFG